MKKARNKHDQYFTPDWVTNVLADRIDISGSVLEPCNGLGGISNVLRKLEGVEVFTSDIDPSFDCDFKGEDYLTSEIAESNVDWVITNPPYTIAPQCTRKALGQATKGVAMFLRLSFFEPCDTREASKRVDLLTEEFERRFIDEYGDEETANLALMHVIILPRIKFSGSNKDTVTTAWFIWLNPDHTYYPHMPSFEILSPDQCVKYGRKKK